MLHECLSLPKVHLYLTAVAWFMVFDIMFHPLSFPAKNVGNTKQHGFDYKQWIFLTRCHILQQEHWKYQTTCHTQPVNCNIIAHKDTLIFYIAQLPHSLNAWVVATFFISATITAMLRYLKMTDKYSPRYGMWMFSLYFMTNILLLTFFDHFQPPFNHTTNSIQ